MQVKLVNPATSEVLREGKLKAVIRKLLSVETRKSSQVLYRVICDNVTLYIGFDALVGMAFVYESTDGTKFLVATIGTKTQFVKPVDIATQINVKHFG